MGKRLLRDVCTKDSSSIAQKDLEDCIGEYPIYGASGFIKNVDFYKQEKPYIAVVKDGAGVGRIMKLPAKSSVIGTLQYIIPNDNVDIDYLAFAMEHMNLSRYYTGATIPHIYFKDYCKEELPEHSADEQKQISLILRKVTELIYIRNQQLLKLSELVKSRFIEMFGDPVLNPKGWMVKPVIDVCECMVPGRDKPKSFTGNMPWITIDDLNVDGITYKSKSNLGLTDDEINEVKRKKVPKGSILMSCVGNLGICSIAGEEMIINQQLHSFQCKDTNNFFLMHYLGFRKDYMMSQASSTTVLYMNKTVCNSIPVYCPPVELQNQFATFVNQVDKLKLAVKESLEKLETMKKALMQQYFS